MVKCICANLALWIAHALQFGGPKKRLNRKVPKTLNNRFNLTNANADYPTMNLCLISANIRTVLFAHTMEFVLNNVNIVQLIIRRKR
jgi:hypothetical protein